MLDELQKRAHEIFVSLLDEEPHARPRLVAHACAGDAGLRARSSGCSTPSMKHRSSSRSRRARRTPARRDTPSPSRPAPSRISHPRRPRGGDGHRLRGGTAQTAPARRAQGDAPLPRALLEHQPLSLRSGDPRPPPTPRNRAGLRGRGVLRQQRAILTLLRDGVRRGRTLDHRLRARFAPVAPRTGGHVRRGLRRRAARTPTRRHPPGPQAQQHPRRPPRRTQDHRFRRRALRPLRQRTHHHHLRPRADPRHPQLHEPRAVQRRRSRRHTLRRLFPRRRALRTPHGQASLRPRRKVHPRSHRHDPVQSPARAARSTPKPAAISRPSP